VHPECSQFLRSQGSSDFISVIEIGSRDINGSARAYWPNATWIGLDLHAGPAVDIICDAERYRPSGLCDLVICCEVLEHAANWRKIIEAAATWIRAGGRMIVTCAGPGRAEHSAIDGDELRQDEYYRNLSADEVAKAMLSAGLGRIECEQVGEDIQAIAYQ